LSAVQEDVHGLAQLVGTLRTFQRALPAAGLRAHRGRPSGASADFSTYQELGGSRTVSANVQRAAMALKKLLSSLF